MVDSAEKYNIPKKKRKASKSPEQNYKPKSKQSKSHSKDAGHLEVHLSDWITRRYEITKFLGDGTFGRVVEVYDH